MNESKDLTRLHNHTKHAVKEKRNDVLIELSLIDFNSVRPFLNSILPDKDISTPKHSVTVLNKCFNLKNTMILFEIGDFPSHIISYPDFTHHYCDKNHNVSAKQLIMVLIHLVRYSNESKKFCYFFKDKIKQSYSNNNCEKMILIFVL